MKDFISPLATLLAAASISGTTATDSNANDLLNELATSLKKSGVSPALREGDWTAMFACTADTATAALIDESTCSSTMDEDGNACVWCDASAILGQGLCASASMKDMAGDSWDQICGDAGSDTIPVDPPSPPVIPVPVITPAPTPKATPNPTEPAPVPAPDDNDDDGGDCTDGAADEASCEAQQGCTWCKVFMLGGSCITSSMHDTVSFLCQSEDQTIANLRGGGGAWKELDPSCLGDTSGLAGDKDSCAGRSDSNGDGCIWCDAGEDVFGICATPSQKDYIGGYMNCAAFDVDAPVSAVE